MRKKVSIVYQVLISKVKIQIIKKEWHVSLIIKKERHVSLIIQIIKKERHVSLIIL